MKKHIHIIGGGVVGLSSAWYLQEAGFQVTLIDRGNFEDSTSTGNAGMIVPSHFVPMSSPGVIQQGIKWMFDSKSPFYVKPRLNLKLAQWLWRFYRSCNNEHVVKSMPILYQFNEWSKELYHNFAQDPKFDFCFERKGLLMLYKTAHQEKEELEMAEKAKQLGVDVETLDAKGLKKLEPEIDLNVLGGVYFPGDAHLYPNMFIQQLYQNLKDQGVQFLTNTEVIDFDYNGSKVNSVQLSSGKIILIDELLVTGGSWTSSLLKRLGIKMLLQDGKGYSYTLQNPILRPRIPTILTESKVAVTPMGEDLRIGGTLELGGMSKKVNKKRLSGILESLPKYYPQMDAKKPRIDKTWIGYRPCTPDGMPYIGRSKSITNLSVATGHGMMGMSMGPATGKLVSELYLGTKTTIDTSMFDLDRFRGTK